MEGANPELVSRRSWQPLFPVAIALPLSLIREDVDSAGTSGLVLPYSDWLGAAAHRIQLQKEGWKEGEVQVWAFFWIEPFGKTTHRT